MDSIKTACHQLNNDLTVIMMVLQDKDRTELDALRGLNAALRMQKVVLGLEAYSVPAHDAGINL